MAEEELFPAESTERVDELTADERPSWFARIRILAFVVAVIVVECLLAWLYLPSLSKDAAVTGAETDANSQADVQANQDEAQHEDRFEGLTEVDLEEYSVTAYQPASGTTLRIDFHLWGMVHEEDSEEVLKLLEGRRHRFREQILFTVRSAAIPDLTDERLGLIKRKTLEKANEVLGKQLLRSLIFDDFSLIEQ